MNYTNNTNNTIHTIHTNNTDMDNTNTPYNPKTTKKRSLADLTKVKGKMMNYRNMKKFDKNKLNKLKTKWMNKQRTIKFTTNTYFDDADNDDTCVSELSKLSDNIVIWDFSPKNNLLNSAMMCEY